MSETTNECRCGRPTRDAAYSCDNCGDSLAKALGDVPWLEDQLDVSVTGQKGVDYRKIGGGSGGKKPNERPSPVAWGPSDARSHLRQILASWVRYCDEERVRNSDYRDGLPANDLAAMSRWLLWRVDGLMLIDIGAEAVDEITSAVAHCHRLIDRPPDKQFLGECRECGGDLYAVRGAKTARCMVCGQAVDAEAVRTALLERLDDQLMTAAEIARASTFLDIKADRDAVRKRINQWHKRKRITSEVTLTDEAVFRFGIVWRLLVSEDGRSETAAS